MNEKEEQNDPWVEYEREVRADFSRSNEIFDRQAFLLGAGALGLSITLIDGPIGGLAEAIGKCWLVLSWVLLTISILSGFISHQLSMEGNQRLMDRLAEEGEGNKEQEVRDILRNWGWWVKACNKFTGGCLIIGIGILLYFVYINVTGTS